MNMKIMSIMLAGIVVFLIVECIYQWLGFWWAFGLVGYVVITAGYLCFFAGTRVPTIHNEWEECPLGYLRKIGEECRTCKYTTIGRFIKKVPVKK